MNKSTEIEQTIQILELKLEQMRILLDQLKKQVGMTKAPSVTKKGGRS